MPSSELSPVEEDLKKWGPDAHESVSVDEAQAICGRLVRRQYENFSVLSSVVPRELREDFAAVYAYCRWADDLGDELGDRARALELLGWWRSELDACYEGEPRHPVFVALHPIIERHDLPREPFDYLIDAFEQDQRVDRYERWEDLVEYCRLSANPVGRLVLMLFGEERAATSDVVKRSDELCTALQLTNHWQDVRRDLEERGRIYVPRTLMRSGGGTSEAFEERLIGTVRQGYAVDDTFLDESRRVIRACVQQTWPLYETGFELLERLSPRARPVIWLLVSGGARVLRTIELWNHETVLHRPTLGRVARLSLVARAWLQSRIKA